MALNLNVVFIRDLFIILLLTLIDFILINLSINVPISDNKIYFIVLTLIRIIQTEFNNYFPSGLMANILISGRINDCAYEE